MKIQLGDPDREKANASIMAYLDRATADGRNELVRLERELSFTYSIMIILLIFMFGLGIVLISVPLIAAFRNNISTVEALTAAGFGVADLAALFLFRPIERMHKMMGDMSQITVALCSFQTQVGLRLLEIDLDDRDSVGRAATAISSAATDGIKLIQEYFEATGPVKQRRAAVAGTAAAG
jgi:uncharacterized protein YhhL (DUF1145 family)